MEGGRATRRRGGGARLTPRQLRARTCLGGGGGGGALSVLAGFDELVACRLRTAVVIVIVVVVVVVRVWSSCSVAGVFMTKVFRGQNSTEISS